MRKTQLLQQHNHININSKYRPLQINRSITKFLAVKSVCEHVKLIKNRRREQTNRTVIQNGEISEKNQASCWQEQGTNKLKSLTGLC